MSAPPAYGAVEGSVPISASSVDAMRDKKRQDVTLYHSPLLGRVDADVLPVPHEHDRSGGNDEKRPPGSEIAVERTVMLPDHITRLRVLVSDLGVHGLIVHALAPPDDGASEKIAEQRTCTIGQVGPPPSGSRFVDYALNVPPEPVEPGAKPQHHHWFSKLFHGASADVERLSGIAVRFYRPSVEYTYLAAVELSTTHGRSSGWIGRSLGQSSIEPYTETLGGKIVGLRYEAVVPDPLCGDASHEGSARGRPLTRLGCIYAKHYGDYSGFMPTTPSGASDPARAPGASSSTSAQREPTEEEKEQENYMREWRREYPFDTGRWTGNRGVGIRWSSDRRKVEIYQGSNDPKNRH